MSLTLTHVTFDKPVYNPGDTITATLGYVSTDYTGDLSVLDSFTMSFTLTDTSGSSTFSSASGDPQFSFSVTEPGNAEAEAVSATASDSGSRTWTQQSSEITSFTPTSGASQGTIVITAVA